MQDTTTHFRPGQNEDRAAIAALLEAAGLPGLPRTHPLNNIEVALRDGRIVGCVALEVRGLTGLLCALCVEPDARGRGIGHELVRSLLPRAYELSLRELWLSTDGPTEIFEHFEFGPVEADSVPINMRSNPCTTGATWMHRKLA